MDAGLGNLPHIIAALSSVPMIQVARL